MKTHKHNWQYKKEWVDWFPEKDGWRSGEVYNIFICECGKEKKVRKQKYIEDEE